MSESEYARLSREFSKFREVVEDKFDAVFRLVNDKHKVLRDEFETVNKALTGDVTKPTELGLLAKTENLMLAQNNSDLRLGKIEGEDQKEEGRMKDMENGITTAQNAADQAHNRLDKKDARAFAMNLVIVANFLGIMGVLVVALLN